MALRRWSSGEGEKWGYVFAFFRDAFTPEPVAGRVIVDVNVKARLSEIATRLSLMLIYIVLG